MGRKDSFGMKMRVIHRYLGFFLAGIMAVYALSGVLMIFRETDFLKKEVLQERQLEPGLTGGELSPKLKMGVKVHKEKGDVLYFEQGNYNTKTGLASVNKATTNSPLYFLNIFFGASLLFFVISSFWMFLPHTSVFKKGMYFTLGGIVLTLILLFV